MAEHEVAFDAMGSHLRVLIGAPGPGVAAAAEAAADARRFIAEFEATLTRFRPESELCRLNEDRREVVPASELLRTMVKAGLAAAERSGGLVDPTLLGEIEAAGYVGSRAAPDEPLSVALGSAPPRQPAGPAAEQSWRAVEVDGEAGTIRRPPGLRFDSGGIGKGLAADLLAARLRGYSRFVVDCGGDIRIGGWDALVNPFEVWIENPLSGERSHILRLGSGAVATSGLNVRFWRGEDGCYRHHLLDPASGEPAWTGLIGATALGDTAVEAETLAKAALLSGPDGGRAVLAELGGLLVDEDGTVEAVGPIGVRTLTAPPRSGRPICTMTFAGQTSKGHGGN